MAVAMGLHIYYNVYYNVYWDESSSVTKPYDWSKNQSGQKSETRPVTYVEIFDKKCILEGVSRLAEYSIWNLDCFFNVLSHPRTPQAQNHPFLKENYWTKLLDYS